MNDTIIAALIGGAVTLFVCLINNHFQNKAIQAKHNETIALVVYRLDELTKKVEKHNGVIERTFKLEEAAAIYDEKMKVVNHRLHDLEDEVKHHEEH